MNHKEAPSDQTDQTNPQEIANEVCECFTKLDKAEEDNETRTKIALLQAKLSKLLAQIK